MIRCHSEHKRPPRIRETNGRQDHRHLGVLLIAAEVLHGVAGGVLLMPYVGDFRSSQIGVFTGSVIILAIAVVTV